MTDTISSIKNKLILLVFSCFIFCCRTKDLNQNNWTTPQNQHFLLEDDLKNERNFRDYVKSLDQTKTEQEYSVSKSFHDNDEITTNKKTEEIESWRTDLHKLDNLLQNSKN